MDPWARSGHLAPWVVWRPQLPLVVLRDRRSDPRWRPWSATTVRAELRRSALAAGGGRRFAPHQLRHAHAVEVAREGVSPAVIQRQLGHSYVSTTSVYLQGINTEEIINAIHAR